MKLPVNPDEKYGLIALNCHTDIQAPVDLGHGFWAAPEGSIEVAKHWQEWLGSIRTRGLRKASLLLVATGPTERVEVLDADNQALLRRVDALYWGLLAAAPLHIHGQGMRVTGSNVNGEIEIRAASDLYPSFHIRGLPLGTATAEVLRRAATLASGVLDLLAIPDMRRMSIAISTFMTAFRESDNGEAVHQFVRAVDGITRAWNKDQFKERCSTFVAPADLPTCRELYMMRSNAEHFHPPDEILPPLPPNKAYIRSYRNAGAAQLLARHCMARLVENRSLWPELTDTKKDSLWNLLASERERLWGPRLNLASAMNAFDERMIPPIGG